MNQNNKLKLIIALILFGLSVLLFSLGIQKYQVTTQTRAEFDGTACNDNVDGTLNSSGSTSFLINCTGNLNRKFKYDLYWCSSQQTGASSCLENRIDTSEGASLTSYLNKSTDKNCGCVQWDVYVYDANGGEGIAGGAMLCSQNSCEQQPTNTPIPTTPPGESTNTPVPTTPPGETTNTPVPTTPPGQSTNTPAPTNTTVPTNSPTPTVTPTGTLIPTNTPTITLTPTLTLTPTKSPTPTNSPTPTITSSPTPTNTPVPTATQAPQPTYATQPTYTPQPTYVAQVLPTATPPTKLVVNNQPPGMTPWMLVLVPIGLILIGLLL